MIHQTTDVAAVNAIINHPRVKPWVSMPGQEVLDASALLQAPHVALLLDDGSGCFLCVQHEPGRYEVHTNLLPAARGAKALDAARAAMDWMFTRTDCVELITKVPVDNPAAQRLTVFMGFTREFTRAQAFPRGTSWVDVDYYSISYRGWIRWHPGLMATGQAFHARLHAEKARSGNPLPDHADDTAHDRYVGAAVRMIENGQIDKGIYLYNRWARFAGYAEIRRIDADRIDILDCVLRISGATFAVEDICQ